MLLTLVTLLIFAIVCGVLLYVARLILAAVPVAQPWQNVIYAVLILILLVLFLSAGIGWVGRPHPWRRW